MRTGDIPVLIFLCMWKHASLWGESPEYSRLSEYLKRGYTFVVDADLQSYFDTIPHEKLIARIPKRITDGTVLGMIRQFLTSGIMHEQTFQKNQ